MGSNEGRDEMRKEWVVSCANERVRDKLGEEEK